MVENDEKVEIMENNKITDVIENFRQLLTEEYIENEENKNKIEEFSSSFFEIIKILKNDAKYRIEELNKDIELCEKSIRTLEKIPQKSKKELEQKETELLNILKKESLLINKFYTLFIGIEDILSIMEPEDMSSISERKGELKDEINKIAKDLELKDIIER